MSIPEMRKHINDVFCGVKQKEIAAMAGVSPVTVKKVMNGDSVTTWAIDQVYKAAVAYQKKIKEVNL